MCLFYAEDHLKSFRYQCNQLRSVRPRVKLLRETYIVYFIALIMFRFSKNNTRNYQLLLAKTFRLPLKRFPLHLVN